MNYIENKRDYLTKIRCQQNFIPVIVFHTFSFHPIKLCSLLLALNIIINFLDAIPSELFLRQLSLSVKTLGFQLSSISGESSHGNKISEIFEPLSPTYEAPK